MNTDTRGFTLIELSIVLVIIGLIVGGVLVGQDLIRAAGVRAQITQIEKYNTAVNTFHGKYGGLPGDLNASLASQFGFVARGTAEGEGDGNGIIEGWATGGMTNLGASETTGETGVFWVDLSQAALLDGFFNTATEAAWAVDMTPTSNPSINQYIPQAKIGRGNYVYVWSGGPLGGDGTNYFGLSAVTGMGGGGNLGGGPGLTVQEAYNIDKKVDDGMPTSGNVTATYLYGCQFSIAWAMGGSTGGCSDNVFQNNSNQVSTVAMAYNPLNCFDNNNVAGPLTYSLAQNANQPNCAVSFRFQ